MLKELIIPSAAAFAFVMTPAMASDANKVGGDVDAHQSGGIYQKAVSIENQQDFDELDANQDGALDEDELNTWGSTAAGNSYGATDESDMVLEEYDHNNDHRVTWKELQDGPSGSGQAGAMQ